ncbi:MAG: cytochrome c [Deltaproteobacteria bacterium]|mgnify:CR=1 FL=1
MKGKAAILAALLFILTPGVVFAWPWSWDMFSQPAHKAQKDEPPAMPEGTVPTTGRPFLNVKTKDEAINLLNPIYPTDGSLERGEVLYNTFCAICHGETGHGNGIVGKKYMTPTDLTSDYVKKLPDGIIYLSIAQGNLGKDDKMSGYGQSISPEDRWHIVNYIKNVLFWKQ